MVKLSWHVFPLGRTEIGRPRFPGFAGVGKQYCRCLGLTLSKPFHDYTLFSGNPVAHSLQQIAISVHSPSVEQRGWALLASEKSERAVLIRPMVTGSTIPLPRASRALGSEGNFRPSTCLEEVKQQRTPHPSARRRFGVSSRKSSESAEALLSCHRQLLAQQPGQVKGVAPCKQVSWVSSKDVL